ncbi:replication initiator protein A [Leptolyngbya sp. PL-A3]|uniref:replication initiator protein A n=1 Tax=Leptolyngbya sp. PL-A3 TaxID=2933911 RepID=UPI003298AD80
MVTRKPPPHDAQLDLFTAVFTDIATRDTQDTMEVPFLSLSKKPRFTPITYKSDTTEITVSGGAPFGIATIWDWDLIMWLLSQVRESLDQGENASRKIRFHPHSFLKAARRACGGVQYQRLDDAIKRLKNTTVVTTLRAKRGKTVMFSWLEYGELERDEQGRIQYATVVLPEWLFEAVSDNRLVLSLHPDYFLLTGGIERWLYRFIRKQAGSNRAGWGWYFQTLYERSGSTQRFSDFVIALREIAGKQTLLDYTLIVQEKDGREYLHAKRGVDIAASPEPEVMPHAPVPQFLHLRTATYEKAKELVPGYDVYTLEADWKEATKRNCVLVSNPDSAFLAWCRKVGARPTTIARKGSKGCG